MRLLNVHTLQFGEFIEIAVPPYCVLSHRRGEDELSHKDYLKGRKSSGAGHRKVVNFCSFVKSHCRTSSLSLDKADWVWIDTICIDKRSSAELSEAVNSMFKWYKNATQCVVHLADVLVYDENALARSNWFDRGWTLQELIAPKEGVIFCDREWRIFGHTCRHQGTPFCRFFHTGSGLEECLTEQVSNITGIQTSFVVNFNPLKKGRSASAAQKMTWASKRRTTRREDEAYCLLGIFNVNMPLIYGEGSKAFLRLQEEIIKRSTDQSIFAWKAPAYLNNKEYGVLAPSPRWFKDSGHISFNEAKKRRLVRPYTITNSGLEMQARLSKLSDSPLYRLQLNCAHGDPGDDRSLVPVQITLKRYPREENYYYRTEAGYLGERPGSLPHTKLPRSLIYVPAVEYGDAAHFYT